MGSNAVCPELELSLVFKNDFKAWTHNQWNGYAQSVFPNKQFRRPSLQIVLHFYEDGFQDRVT